MIIFFILIFISCSPKQDLVSKNVPSGIIQPDTMAAIIVDLQVAEAALRQMKNNGQVTDSIVNKAFELIFIKHKITQDELKKSTAYYQENLDNYDMIYSNVITRLTQLQTEINSTE